MLSTNLYSELNEMIGRECNDYVYCGLLSMRRAQFHFMTDKFHLMTEPTGNNKHSPCSQIVGFE